MENNQSGIDGFLKSSKVLRSPVNVQRSDREQRAYNREMARNTLGTQNQGETMALYVPVDKQLGGNNGDTIESNEASQNNNRSTMEHLVDTTDDLIMLSGEIASGNTTVPLVPSQLEPPTATSLPIDVPRLNISSSTNIGNTIAILPLTEANVSRISQRDKRSIGSHSSSSRYTRSSEYLQKMHEIERRRIDIEETAAKRRLAEEERFLKASFEGKDSYGSERSRARRFTERLNQTWTYVESQPSIQSARTLSLPPESFEYNDDRPQSTSSVLFDPDIATCFGGKQRSSNAPKVDVNNIQNIEAQPTVGQRGVQPISNSVDCNQCVGHNLSSQAAIPSGPPQRLVPPGCPPQRLVPPGCPPQRLVPPGCLPQRLVPPGCLPSSEYLQLNKIQHTAYSQQIPSAQSMPSRNVPMHSTFVSSSVQQPPSVPQPSTSSLPTFTQTATQTIYPEVRCVTNAPLNSTLMPTSMNTMSSVNRTLTTEELAARHTVAKTLPRFSGNPDEWPLFIVNFNQATIKCNFSDAENLMRLQKSLHGKALQAVRGFLMVPETVPRVMETLQTLFGRPEQIIKSLQKKLRSELTVKPDRLDSLVEFALSLQNYCATVSATGLEAYLNDPMLLDDLTMKLPPQTRLDWSVYSGNTASRTLTSFSQWLYNLAMCASQVLPLPSTSGSNSEKKTNRNSSDKGQVQQTFHVNESQKSGSSQGDVHRSAKNTCVICEGEHKIDDCDMFVSKSVPERWELAKSKKACFRCLQHFIKHRCNSKNRCSINNCRLKHHRLLHDPTKRSSQKTPTSEDNKEETSSIVVGVHYDGKKKKTLFRILPVIIRNNDITKHTYAFIDEGSSSTLIDKRLANALSLDGPNQELCIKWTNDISRVEESSKTVDFEIQGCFDGATGFMVNGARTVKHLNLPFQTFKFTHHNTRLHDLPIQEYDEVQPEILIGLDNYHLACPLEVRQGREDDLIATRSKLGWSVYGGASTSSQMFHICECQSTTGIHDIVKNFFSLESFGISPSIKPVESTINVQAKEIMERTIKKVGNRYEVGLLWKEDPTKLPNNYEMALRRWKCTETKMRRDPTVHEFIHGKVTEYLTKNYIRKLGQDEKEYGGPVWYIPIFVVNSSNKNKPRLVWDCAAAMDGIALNNFLMSGPDLLKTLPGILLRFRNKQFALCGDIREMFHQIQVIPSDQNVQRFLYRKRPEDPIQTYVMQVLTFGATCSPTLSQYVKNRHAMQYNNTQPAATNAIIENTYVDDWLQCADTEEELIDVAKAVIQIYKEGGFEIRGWISNSKSVLEEIGAITKDQVPKSVGDCEDKAEKILGLWWMPESDEFTFYLNPKKFGEDLLNGKTPTKREVLRVIMAVFDPLGYLTHVMVYAKIILREIWHSGLDWDQRILPVHEEKWKSWLEVIKNISNIRIPRFYGWTGEVSHQMHVFVDASCNAFGAVVYLRTSSYNQIKCTLMGGKCKVAPQKPISIPRLELMGAVLGARLYTNFKSLSGLIIDDTVFWCDSENVLNWINSEARNFRQFVALRIGEIFELTNINQWRWVSSKNNVADEATKWTKTPEINFNTRWYNGPEFLLLPPTEWPTGVSRSEVTHDTHDVERIHITSSMIGKKFFEVCPDVSRFSSWSRLVRTTAYVDRFLCCILAKKFGTIMKRGPINHEEYSLAENILFRLAQREGYGVEVDTLLKGNRLNPNSPIYSCCPYLDEDQLMRVYGRIDLSIDIPTDTKRPIILPVNHEITHLVIRSVHLRFYHQMHEVVISELRKRFWIPKLRRELKVVRGFCNRCKIRNCTPEPPQMGMLPVARMSSFCPAFTHTGLDFFGPMEVLVGRRIEKRWGALFTCLTTRAVYIESTPSLSTDSCIMIVNNFMVRRGVPTDMYSDQGTNFRGANNLLVEELKKMDKDDLQEKVKFKWHFNPPASPHMGGAWERMIKTTKSILTEIIPQRRPTDEVLRCALAEIEGILNKRPLTHVPLDEPGQDPLTPGDLLMIHNGGAKPFEIRKSDGLSLRNNFRKVQEMANEFWKRWVGECLPNLTRRAKWFDPPIKPIKIGDVVIIVDENQPRNVWLKGVVKSMNVGKDGNVRSAEVFTKNGTYTRPVVKLAVLDIMDSKPTQLTGGSVTIADNK